MGGVSPLEKAVARAKAGANLHADVEGAGLTYEGSRGSMDFTSTKRATDTHKVSSTLKSESFWAPKLHKSATW